MNGEVLRKAKMFASDEIGLMYALTSNIIEWQKETGLPLEYFLEYLENTCPKKEA